MNADLETIINTGVYTSGTVNDYQDALEVFAAFSRKYQKADWEWQLMNDCFTAIQTDFASLNTTITNLQGQIDGNLTSE